MPYLATALLALATVYAACASFRPQRAEGVLNRLFPNGAKLSTRRTVVIGTLSTLLGVIIWLAVDAPIRHSSRFLIPEGYVGWVRIEFQVVGAPVLPIERGVDVFRIPPSGLLRTSSPEEFGWAKDQYRYYSEKSSRILPDTNSGAGGLVWGKINGEETDSQGKRTYEEFFVGTRQQFAEQTSGEPKVGSSVPTATPK
jgi:uncharacterized protein DUF6843